MPWKFYSGGGFEKTGEYIGSEVPVGTVVRYTGLTVPTGWLFCDGAAVSRSGYADLFNVISTTYGAGNGTTTFNVPDSTGDIIYASPLARRVQSGGNTSITEAMLASNAVTTTKISNSAVTSAKIAPGAFSPVGSITQYGGSTAPTNWLICDGSEQAVASYPDLDAVLGTIYGSRTNGSGSAGSSHFRLPDLRGRVPVGAGNGVGGQNTDTPLSGTGNPSGGSNLTARTVGQWGGQEQNAISIANMPVHNHGGSTGLQYVTKLYGGSLGIADNNDRPASMFGGNLRDTGADQHAHSISSQGGGGAHNNLQPFVVVNYIIRAA